MRLPITHPVRPLRRRLAFARPGPMPAERSAGPSIATANGNIVLRTDSELELHSKTGTLLLPKAVDTITEKQGALEA